MASGVDGQNKRRIKNTPGTPAFFSTMLQRLKFLLVYCLEFTEQALVCLVQSLVEVIATGNQVRAITGGRVTEGDVTHKEHLGHFH